jgi:hypothetical protein
MLQFGCRSAISGVACGSRSGARAERAAARGQDHAAHAVDALAAQALEDRRVLGVDGHDLAAALARELDELRAGHHERLLVRERERPPALEHADGGQAAAAPTTPCTATS